MVLDLEKRDNPAFALELYRAHRQSLILLSSSIVGCKSLAEDIVHEAFERLAQKKQSEIEKPLRYVTMTVRNLSIDLYRSQQRERKVILYSIESESLENIKTSEHSPEQQMAIKQDYVRFNEAVNELPNLTKKATILHLVEQLSVRAIAERLDVPVTKAYRLIKEGTSHCRDRLWAGER